MKKINSNYKNIREFIKINNVNINSRLNEMKKIDETFNKVLDGEIELLEKYYVTDLEQLKNKIDELDFMIEVYETQNQEYKKLYLKEKLCA